MAISARGVLTTLLVLSVLAVTLASYQDFVRPKKIASETAKWLKKPYKHQHEHYAFRYLAEQQAGRRSDSDFWDEEDMMTPLARQGGRTHGRQDARSKDHEAPRRREDERKTRRLTKRDVEEGSETPSVESKMYPQSCAQYAHDNYKLEKCERKANLMAQQSTVPPSEGKKETKFPHCEIFAYDPYKLEMCERKAKFIAQTAVPQSTPHLDGLKHPHCQYYAYDPYKFAKCESKAAFYATISSPEAQHLTEELPSHPQCQHFAYDPYKLAKCEYKMRKYYYKI